jgi:protoheme IX farnesyltransferase
MTTTTANSRLSTYLELSKSGIVALVLISVLGGYLVGQPPESTLSLGRLLATLTGILLLASGSSALNQLQERVVDATMPRTARRPLPSGRLSSIEAWAFIGATLASGLAILWGVAPALFLLGVLAVASYNGLYTLWWKRHWAHAAVPGAIPGALPILMGHAAASRHVTAPGGLYLFALLFFWQMPHFWVLALRYREDYRSGGFPTLPVKLGSEITVLQITLWCLAYLATALLAPLVLGVRSVYLAAALAMALKVLWELRRFALEPEGKRWLRFFLWVNLSLIVFIAAAVLDLWSWKL